MNANELARNKFAALFADHDAKDIRGAKQTGKTPLKTVKNVDKK